MQRHQHVATNIDFFNTSEGDSDTKMVEVEDCQKAIPLLRSCERECDQPMSGLIKGEIPLWLNGNLIRIGSGLLRIGPDQYNHVFDGMSLMHKFSIQDGQVTYSNKFLRSDTYRKNMEANRIVVSEFGTRASPDLCKTIFHRFSSLFSLDNFTDNDLINILKFTDEYYACSETNYIWRIDPDSLESVKKVDLRKFVSVTTATAHAHEEADGTMYNLGSSFTPRVYYNILKIPPKCNSDSIAFEDASIICKIPSSNFNRSSYYHSFGMTERYLVFVEQPLEISVPGILWAHFTWNAYVDSLKWHPQQMARFYVIRKDTGAVLKTKYLSNPFMVFHHINAFEDSCHLVVDLCSYKDDIAIRSMYVEALKDYFDKKETASTAPFGSQASRFVLPLNEVDIAEKAIGENLVMLEESSATAVRQRDGSVLCNPESLIQNDLWAPELPRINYEGYNGKKYKYFYSIGRRMESDEIAVIKVDTKSKTELVWSEDGRVPSEPVFIPSPNSSEEDEGVLLVSLLSKSDSRAVSLVVLSAKSMTELGRSDFQTVSSVPADFHGIFIPKKRAS